MMRFLIFTGAHFYWTGLSGTVLTNYSRVKTVKCPKHHPHAERNCFPFFSFVPRMHVCTICTSIILQMRYVSICMSVVVHMCSENAGRWCCLDAGHTDIFEAEVGLSHCMSMSPRVTPVWLLQEMTQISPSAFRDTASQRGKWRRWYRRSNKSKTWCS